MVCICHDETLIAFAETCCMAGVEKETSFQAIQGLRDMEWTLALINLKSQPSSSSAQGQRALTIGCLLLFRLKGNGFQPDGSEIQRYPHGPARRVPCVRT